MQNEGKVVRISFVGNLVVNGCNYYQTIMTYLVKLGEAHKHFLVLFYTNCHISDSVNALNVFISRSMVVAGEQNFSKLIHNCKKGRKTQS